MKRKALLLLIILLFMSICTACFEPTNDIDRLQDEDVTLKIFTNQKNNIESRYIDVLRLYYPNLNFIVIDEGYSEAGKSGDWKTWLEHHQPDLIISSGKDMYQQLIDEELVIPLDTYIARDDYSLDELVPGAIEWIRMQSPDNQLYGLATEFFNQVIFYNKEHFDNLNIPYPDLHMSWTELLQLARRFHVSEDGIYGLQISTNTYSPLELIYEAAFAEGLNFIDVQKKEVYIRLDAWKEIFEEVISTVEAGGIHYHFEVLPENAAMVFSNLSYEFYELNYAKDASYEKWGVTHYPVNMSRSIEYYPK